MSSKKTVKVMVVVSKSAKVGGGVRISDECGGAYTLIGYSAENVKVGERYQLTISAKSQGKLGDVIGVERVSGLRTAAVKKAEVPAPAATKEG